VSLLIAVGELAVGLGTLLGLWTRIAATGGALLSLTFALTVSWNTTPYYYGADIGFVFSWLVLLAFGAVGGLSADAWLRKRARGAMQLGPDPTSVAIDVPRLQKLCARGQKCGLTADGTCTRPSGCPVFPLQETLPTDLRDELDRRILVVGVAAAAVAGLFALILGGFTAVIGRVIGGTPKAIPANPPGQSPSSPSPGTNAAPDTASGTAVGAASSVPVGRGLSVSNPADGSAAWVVHTSASTFVAFSAICTHAGCTVQYDASNVQFACPCHGGVFDARTGQVLQGPPPTPLPSIPVQVVNGKIRIG
jgi:thiosulfate dehydrogenase [quinone] large subunit